jgi:hypothetical protein
MDPAPVEAMRDRGTPRACLGARLHPGGGHVARMPEPVPAV